jgi:acyl carrier protein
MAAALSDRDQARRVSLGFQLIAPAHGRRVLDALLSERDRPQVAVMPVDWPVLLRGFAAGAEPAMLSTIAGEARCQAPARSSGEPILELSGRLERALPGERRDLLVAHVREQVVRVLGLDPSMAVDPQQGLTDLGMDSLMAVELRNRLEASSGRRLPTTLAFEHPTIEALADFLGAHVLRLASAPSPGPLPTPRQEPTPAERSVETLSATELEATLLDELDKAGY